MNSGAASPIRKVLVVPSVMSLMRGGVVRFKDNSVARCTTVVLGVGVAILRVSNAPLR